MIKYVGIKTAEEANRVAEEYVNNEVSYDNIGGFKAITKTDIKDTIVNLDEGIVYLPYQEY